MIVAEVAERVAEHPDVWGQVWEMVTSPADYLGHFVIEGVFTIVGVHAVHKMAHTTVHSGARRIRNIGRKAKR